MYNMIPIHTVFEFNKTMFLFFILCFAFKVSCITLDSRCPEKIPAENFNLSGIGNGVWYEVARYPYPAPKPVKHMTYATRMEEDVYVAETINVNKSSPYYTKVVCEMLPDANGKAMVTFVLYSGGQLQMQSPLLYFLAVDYNEYIVPYTCIYDPDRDEIHEYAWILTRSKPVLGKSKQEFMDIQKDLGLDEDKLIWF